MVSQTAFQLTLDFLTSKPVVVVPSADQVSSDAGLLPFRQLDERIGLTRERVRQIENQALRKLQIYLLQKDEDEELQRQARRRVKKENEDQSGPRPRKKLPPPETSAGVAPEPA